MRATKLPRNRPRQRPLRPTLQFTPTAWAKLLYLRDRGDTEIGGFGITWPRQLLTVHEIALVRQGHLPDNRHRMLLHNSFGILLAEQVFGPAISVGSDRRVFVRDIGTQHVLEDLGFVPTVAECLAALPLQPWMSGAVKLLRHHTTEPATSGRTRS